VLQDDELEVADVDAFEREQLADGSVGRHPEIDRLLPKPLREEMGVGLVLLDPPSHGEGIAEHRDLGSFDRLLRIPKTLTIDEVPAGECARAEDARSWT